MAPGPSPPTLPAMNGTNTPHWPTRIALAAAVALIVGYALTAPRTPTRSCAAGAPSLAVVASQEKSALLRELAQDPRGWAARGHPEWGRFRLGKTDPRISTSGLHALIGAFFAATGRSADLTEKDVADERIRAFVKGVESSVVHYGETVSTFIRNLRAADQRGTALTYVSAIAIEEKQVWDYNQGQNGARPAIPLAAVSPKEGTLVADHPYVVLNAPWVDAPKRDAAAGFLAYLQGTEAQARFRAAGFRDKDGRGGPELALANGIVPAGPAIVISPPAPTVLAAIQRSWDDVRKRARVLMVLDVSGP